MTIAQAYIASAFVAPDILGIQDNCNHAIALARMVAIKGAHPVCVHALGQFCTDLRDVDWWYAATADCMRKCDVVVAAHSWQKSKGAVAEVELAESLNIPVFIARDDLEVPCFEAWIAEWNRKQVAA